MALDSRDKRLSAINVSSPWRGLLPTPDAAAETAGDRATLAHMAGSVAAGAATQPTTLGDLQTLMAAYYITLRSRSPGDDLTMLIAEDQPTVRAENLSPDDLNTEYAIFLS